MVYSLVKFYSQNKNTLHILFFKSFFILSTPSYILQKKVAVSRKQLLQQQQKFQMSSFLRAKDDGARTSSVVLHELHSYLFRLCMYHPLRPPLYSDHPDEDDGDCEHPECNPGVRKVCMRLRVFIVARGCLFCWDFPWECTCPVPTYHSRRTLSRLGCGTLRRRTNGTPWDAENGRKHCVLQHW